MQKLLCLVVLVYFFIACKNQATDKKETTTTVAGAPEKKVEDDNKSSHAFYYDVDKPDQTWSLPDSLREISGISWIDANHLVAIEDLHARLYLLNMDKTAGIEKTIQFKDDKDKKFDVEDVTVVGDKAFTIWSHGAIFEIDSWKTQPAINEYSTGLSKEDNTEGVCFDAVTGNLLVACKGHGEDAEEKKSARAVYVFDLKEKKLLPAPLFIVKKKSFAEKVKEKVAFNPSAISVDPVTHNIYILSTKGTKCMAVFSRDGELLSFQYLNADIFPQPEGLCFSPDGTLYISSEGKKSAAVICKFSRQAGTAK